MGVIDLLRAGIELLVAPLDALPEWAALTVVSVVSGVFALLVVKGTTDQVRVAAARDQLLAAVLEMRIFLDSPKKVFRAQGRVVRWTARYVAVTLPALVLLAVPLTLVFLHLAARHEVAPIPVGEQVLVTVELSDATAVPDCALGVPAGVEQTAPLFRSPGACRARVKAVTAGRHVLDFEVGEHRVTKLLVSGDLPTLGRGTSPERRGGIAALWALGVERALNGEIQRVSIDHPAAERPWLGMPWWLGWLLVSTGAALLLKGPFGVVI